MVGWSERNNFQGTGNWLVAADCHALMALGTRMATCWYFNEWGISHVLHEFQILCCSVLSAYDCGLSHYSDIKFAGSGCKMLCESAIFTSEQPSRVFYHSDTYLAAVPTCWLLMVPLPIDAFNFLFVPLVSGWMAKALLTAHGISLVNKYCSVCLLSAHLVI